MVSKIEGLQKILELKFLRQILRQDSTQINYDSKWTVKNRLERLLAIEQMDPLKVHSLESPKMNLLQTK